jgi:hypothetical protein
MHYLSALLLLHFVLNLFTQATPRSGGIDGKIANVRLLVCSFSLAGRDWKLHPLHGCMASGAGPRRGRTLYTGARSRTTASWQAQCWRACGRSVRLCPASGSFSSKCITDSLVYFTAPSLYISRGYTILILLNISRSWEIIILNLLNNRS